MASCVSSLCSLPSFCPHPLSFQRLCLGPSPRVSERRPWLAFSVWPRLELTSVAQDPCHRIGGWQGVMAPEKHLRRSEKGRGAEREPVAVSWPTSVISSFLSSKSLLVTPLTAGCDLSTAGPGHVFVFLSFHEGHLPCVLCIGLFYQPTVAHYVI